jgi:hypothetical protein
MFTRYKTVTMKRSGIKVKAPATVIEDVQNAGYFITTSSGKYAQVMEYDKNTHRARYIAPLSYFISDRIAGYKDGNGCNLVKSNLIMMED